MEIDRIAPKSYNKIMLLTSPAFPHEEWMPEKFTCEGGNMNPELVIQNVPANAKSLALIVYDPDAPTGMFTHWLVWNIDPKTTVIKEESVPPGAVEGQNDGGELGYMGPCPPPGTPHRYVFKLYALESLLTAAVDASKEELEREMRFHRLEEAELIGMYGR